MQQAIEQCGDGGGVAQLQGGFRGFVGRGRPVLLGEAEHAENPADTRGTLVVVDVRAHGVKMRAGVACVREQRDCRPRRTRRAIRVSDPMPAARGADVLTQELSGRRRQESHVPIGPLHLDALADPAGRRGVVGGLDLDAAIEMRRPHPVAVVAKRFDGQRLDRGAWQPSGVDTCRQIDIDAVRHSEGPLLPRVGSWHGCCREQSWDG